MTITLQAVNELIQSLESAGELSIREQKFLKLAKAYQQLAAENVALKESRNNLAEFIHEELDADYPLNMNLETHATDHIVAEAEARGVEKAIAHLEKKFSNIGVQIMNLQWLADSLRKGASE
ncbi:TPA: hypothetical protein QHQ08_004512 [Klebsiella pneumoniae subsp. pneumoniae]|nr:hypothetical protein [Klebsiella pneumoniae subsp. pneumoniae]